MEDFHIHQIPVSATLTPDGNHGRDAPRRGVCAAAAGAAEAPCGTRRPSFCLHTSGHDHAHLGTATASKFSLWCPYSSSPCTSTAELRACRNLHGSPACFRERGGSIRPRARRRSRVMAAFILIRRSEEEEERGREKTTCGSIKGKMVLSLILSAGMIFFFGAVCSMPNRDFAVCLGQNPF